jgi:acyl carrier protein
MADDASFETFKKCAVDVLSVDADKVTMDARFAEDLGADSLDLVEFVMALEEAFDVSVDESELDGVETVRQAYDLVTSKQS